MKKPFVNTFSKKSKEKPEITYPLRLNRYLYLKNYCSRRQADRYIERGLVKINGKVATLGEKVEARDEVKLAPEITEAVDEYVYLAVNKPRGIVSHDPGASEKSILDVLKLPPHLQNKNLVPLGRLDKASTGLLLLSNDGRIVNALLHPDSYHEKEYLVEVDKKIKGHHLQQMESGVDIEGYTTKKAKATRESDRSFSLILHEGKKHQIRRMCAALGYQVKSLKRIRIQNITLGKVRSGEFREITGKEREVFLRDLL